MEKKSLFSGIEDRILAKALRELDGRVECKYPAYMEDRMKQHQESAIEIKAPDKTSAMKANIHRWCQIDMAERAGRG